MATVVVKKTNRRGVTTKQTPRRGGAKKGPPTPKPADLGQLKVANPFQLASLWVSNGGPRQDAPLAAAVALGESGGRLDAYNPSNSDGSSDSGPWQINSIHGYDSNRLRSDWNYSARAAVEVYERAGNSFGPWVVFNTGAYKEHVDEVQASLENYVGGLKEFVDTDDANAAERFARGPVGDIVEGALTPLEILGTIGANLLDPEWWKRTGQYLGGIALIAFGLVLIAREYRG